MWVPIFWDIPFTSLPCHAHLPNFWSFLQIYGKLWFLCVWKPSCLSQSHPYAGKLCAVWFHGEDTGPVGSGLQASSLLLSPISITTPVHTFPLITTPSLQDLKSPPGAPCLHFLSSHSFQAFPPTCFATSLWPPCGCPKPLPQPQMLMLEDSIVTDTPVLFHSAFPLFFISLALDFLPLPFIGFQSCLSSYCIFIS